MPERSRAAANSEPKWVGVAARPAIVGVAWVPRAIASMSCWPLGRGWGLAFALIVALALVAEQVALGRSHIDGPLACAFEAVRAEWLDAFMRGVTWAGRGEVLCLAIIGGAFWAIRSGDTNAVRYLVCASIGAALLTSGLKLLFARERPDLLERLVPAGGFSFPSGHSMGSMAVYGAVARWLGERGVARRQSTIASALVLLVIMVGISRAYLRTHFASDVVGGWAFGLLWLAALEPLLVTRRVTGD